MKTVHQRLEAIEEQVDRVVHVSSVMAVMAVRDLLDEMIILVADGKDLSMQEVLDSLRAAMRVEEDPPDAN